MWIHRFSRVFFSCYCFTPVTVFIIRSEGSTEKQPAVQTLPTRRRFATRKPIKSQIFSTRGTLLLSLLRGKRLKAKYPHECCWKWTFPRAMSKTPSFSRRCDTACNYNKIYLGKSRKLGPLSFLVVQITVMNTSIFVLILIINHFNFRNAFISVPLKSTGGNIQQ